MNGAPLATRALPWLALAVAALAPVLFTSWAVRAHRMHRRPAALAAALAAQALPLLLALGWTRLVDPRWLRLAHPWLSIPVAVVTTWMAVRLGRVAPRSSSVRKGAIDLLTLGAALAAGLAATGLELGRPLDAMTLLVAIDRSRSIDRVPNADARLRAELAAAETGMREHDRIGTVAFAAGAAVEDPPRPRGELPSPQRALLVRDGTDVAAGIRRALAEIPPGSAARVVVVSDGVATRGDAMQAAASAVGGDVPVDVVPLDQRPLREVRVTAVRGPGRADAGEPIELRVVTGSPVATEVELRVLRDGQLVRASRVAIGAGEDVLRLREVAPGPGLHRFDVEITDTESGLDKATEDDVGSTFVRVRGGSAALVVDGDGQTGRVARALEGAAFRVTEGTSAAIPDDVGGLAAYDLLVLGDVRAADLAPAQLEAIASWVRDLGGGLLLVGGDRSMGPGGFSHSPVEEVSPVSFDLSQRRRKASLSEVIAIDISGSMSARVGATTKLALANEAAARSAALLAPDDRLGVAHVDTAAAWTVPLAPVTAPAAIGERIRKAGAGGGGIYVDVALREGYAALDREKTQLRHMLLFADGDDAEQLGGCRALVTGAASRGVTTSIVALGRGHDVAELEVLSRLGHGRFYLVEDAARLPAVFAEETVVASRAAIQEVEFVPSPGEPSPVTRGVDLAAAPALRGYVATIAKPRATVLLGAPDGDPLLATWSVGLGRAAAFTSDLKDRWGARWASFPDAAQLVAQLGRDLARRDDDPHVRLAAEASQGELRLRADVIDDDGRAQSFRRLVAVVAGPDGNRREVPLDPVAAGAYAATVPLGRTGAYVATVRDELRDEAVGTTGAVLSAGEELRDGGTDRALLARIAATTGGKVRDSLAGIFRERPPRRFAYAPVGPTLALLAALAMLLGVAARRVDPPETWGPALAATWARVRPRLRRAEAPVASTFGALARAKERAGARAGAPDGAARPFVPAGHGEARPAATPAQAPGAPAPRGPAAAAGSPASGAPAGAERARTAAEILAERRRNRRG